MTYIDYRRRVEFGRCEFAAIARHCCERGILWFASCWDEESVDFMDRFDPPCYKAASGIADRRGAARPHAGDRPAADPVDRHVDA
jgi:sialic acid synthase SpsE